MTTSNSRSVEAISEDEVASIYIYMCGEDPPGAPPGASPGASPGAPPGASPGAPAAEDLLENLLENLLPPSSMAMAMAISDNGQPLARLPPHGRREHHVVPRLRVIRPQLGVDDDESDKFQVVDNFLARATPWQ